jgi:hypothetical protein
VKGKSKQKAKRSREFKFLCFLCSSVPLFLCVSKVLG